MLAGGNDDAEARTCVDVDVRIDASLADEFQPGQTFQQGGTDGSPFADQYQNVALAQPISQNVGCVHMIVPNLDLVGGEPREARQGAQGIEVVVEDADFHGLPGEAKVYFARLHISWAAGPPPEGFG